MNNVFERVIIGIIRSRIDRVAIEHRRTQYRFAWRAGAQSVRLVGVVAMVQPGLDAKYYLNIPLNCKKSVQYRLYRPHKLRAQSSLAN